MTAQTKPDVPAVYSGISAVMAEMAKEGISKARRSGDGGGPKFSFRGIDDVYNALAPVMSANHLMMLPRMISRDQQERQTKNGGMMFYTTVEAEFDIVSGIDGSRHTIRTFGEAMDSSDKSTNKAMSAAFKYAAMQAFCIPTEGDNDADATTHEVVPRGEPQGMPADEWAKLTSLLKATGVPVAKLLKEYGVENLRLISWEQYLDAVQRLNDVLAQKAKAETDAKAKQQAPADDFSDLDVPF